MMSKKRKITKEMLLSATGRKPSQPEPQSLPGTPTQQELERIDARKVAMNPALAAPYGINAGADILDPAEQFFTDVFSGKKAPAAKGRWAAASGQMQNIPRNQTDKDNADEQQID